MEKPTNIVMSWVPEISRDSPVCAVNDWAAQLVKAGKASNMNNQSMRIQVAMIVALIPKDVVDMCKSKIDFDVEDVYDKYTKFWGAEGWVKVVQEVIKTFRSHTPTLNHKIALLGRTQQRGETVTQYNVKLKKMAEFVD